MKLILTGILEGIRTCVDGGVKVTINTNEIDATQAGNLLQLRNKFVKLLLSDTNISAMEEKLIDEENMQDGRKVKTKSQRLRAVLYRVWEQSEPQQEFNQYYDSIMEGLIDHYKQKLD